MADTKFRRAVASSGIPAAALGAPAAAPAPSEKTTLAQRLSAIAVGELVDLPGLGTVWMQPVGHADANRIEAATVKYMTAEGLPQVPLNAWSYDCHRHARLLHLAARDPDDHSKPFGSLAQWLGDDPDCPQVTDDMLFAWGKIYDDVKARLDPFGAPQLDAQLLRQLSQDFEKKNPILFMSYGVAVLSSWLASGALQLSTSPTAASSSGGSSAEPSSE